MPSEIVKTDILIIGAGPAGATASLFLAKLGIPHLIADAAIFPRDKVCGDGLDLKVVRVLRHLDPAITEHELPANQMFTPCWGTRFFTQNGRIADFIYNPPPGTALPHPLFWTAKRFCFDAFLAKKFDKRYADFRQGVKVEHIQKDGNEWRVLATTPSDLEIRASLIIGADGDHSVLLRHLGERKIDRRHYAGTLRQYWRGVADIHPKNLIEVYFPPGLPMSYFYIFPLANGEANVGYGMVSEVAAKGRHKLRDIFERLIREDPVMAPRFQRAESLEEPVGWGIPLASRRRRAFGDGYLLAGDAASLVCPTSGEGIGTGMISGYIAAHFAQKALLDKRFDAEQFKNYDRELYRRLQSEIRLYNLMMSLSPRVYDFGLNLIAPHPLFRWSFRQRVGGWLKTAYETPIEVRF
ncbi:MAG: NAD(P)/FAD-dependent oxidoreductase [Haliscomenobacteraceae bacterium CHB4]|nr:Menaquinone reductase [Saprospiraceae bacterium]MCE7923960.1 NAD(P)/FAD-dependent oxidoreductase [Haliscomenobacteraceae bacterium CHB4]